ncbi:Networked 4B [Hibiscus trionum]|uniref:Networked 4B n=1 Tax=Hibiscus trionum TaxID=183268 RepID=A0A9W7J7R3_HIBTR|nr:Networked 4B [Hibiscus trionum]
MANSSAQLTRSMRRLESRKSHSWWWDSHISPKNSKWLAENLDEMDRRVKQMLKLIEEDADSFAKKAEMYYKKRPELITQVEEFYRMYRSLAERYDHVTGELRKSMSSEIQSQGSGISEIASDLPLSCPSSDQRLSPRKSGPRAAGGNSSDVYPKGDKSSSSTGSESESDDYSVLSGNEGDQGLSGKMAEMEIELHEMKEKLRMLEEENTEREAKNDNSDLLARSREYEEELKIANERIHLSEEKVTSLKIELLKYKQLGTTGSESSIEESVKMDRPDPIEVNQALQLQNEISVLEKENQHLDSKIHALLEELSTTKEMLKGSEKENASLMLEKKQFYEKIQDLQGQLDTAQREILELKLELAERSNCIKVLTEDLETSKSERNGLKSEMYSLQAKVSSREVRIVQMDMHLHQLHMEHVKLIAKAEGAQKIEEELQSKVKELEDEIKKQRTSILEGAEAKREAIRQLCFTLEHYRNGYHTLRQAVIGHKRIPVLTI